MLEEAREKAQLDFNSYMGDARREGKAEGKAEGKVEGKAETLLNILAKRFQTVPEPLETRILAITDLAQLDKFINFALDCESLEAFSEVM